MHYRAIMATRHAHMPVRGRAHFQVHHAAASEQYGLALRLSSITVDSALISYYCYLPACLAAGSLWPYQAMASMNSHACPKGVAKPAGPLWPDKASEGITYTALSSPGAELRQLPQL